MKKLFFLLLICSGQLSIAQDINKHIAFTTIYDFLDELANGHIIELNSAVKPFSRKFISEKLYQADTVSKERLTRRQQKDLAFFLKDYNKELYPDKKFKKRLDLFYYKDSLFSFTINPILGYSHSINQNGSASHRWNGGEFYGYVGKHIAFYFSLRDNGVSSVLSKPDYLTQLPGANYKPFQGTDTLRTDFSEARGGISYGWKWGSVSLMKDNFEWGNNYHGANIFSGRQPSFAYLSFKMKPAKWFEFNYVHGWLISQVLDSAKTYGLGSSLRKSFYPKFLAANLFTIRPFKNFYFSLGNSIVYADKYVQPIYLIPFMFYKSADHTMNGSGSNSLGENSHMFLDISCRNISKTHLYGTLFIDEVHLSKIFDSQKQTNLFSFKAGVRVTNLLLKNTSFTLEYTRTNPWVYVHPIATTTFASNNYNMGNYLGQNAEEIFLGFKFKPLRGLLIDLGYTYARKGPVLDFIQVNGVNNVAGTPFMKGVEWANDAVSMKVQYELFNDVLIFGEVNSANIRGNMLNKYTPSFYYGNTTTINGGIVIGF